MSKKYVKYGDEEQEREFRGMRSHLLYTEEDTPIPGCVSLVHVITSTEYTPEQAHEDNEGFFVARGSGTFRLDGNEYPLKPGCAMYAPAGMMHAMKSDGSEMEVFVYHFPA